MSSGSRSTGSPRPTARRPTAWNTTGVAAGTYYLSGYMYDSATGKAVYSHLGTSIVIT